MEVGAESRKANPTGKKWDVTFVQHPAPLRKRDHRLHAVLGEFEAQRQHFPAAAEHLREAIRLTEVKSERSFLAARLRECEARA